MLYVPYESSYTYFFVAFVQFAHGEKEGFNFVVSYHGEDGVVQFGPCVGATVWVAIFIASALNVLPKGEASDGQDIKHVFDTLRIGLIEYDEYAFHVFLFFRVSHEASSMVEEASQVYLLLFV